MTATHPTRCRCDGTGHLPAGPRTVRPCDHDWWNDDPWPDTGPLLSRADPRAQAAIDQAYTEGLAELDAIRNRNRQGLTP